MTSFFCYFIKHPLILGEGEWVVDGQIKKMFNALVIIFAAGVIKLPIWSFGNYTDKLATRTMAQKSNK